MFIRNDLHERVQLVVCVCVCVMNVMNFSLLCFFFSSHSLHTNHRFDHYELLFSVFICLHLKNDRIASLLLLLLVFFFFFLFKQTHRKRSAREIMFGWAKFCSGIPSPKIESLNLTNKNYASTHRCPIIENELPTHENDFRIN